MNLETLLQQIAQLETAQPDSPQFSSQSTEALIALINLLRPSRASHIEQAKNNVLALCYLLEQQKELREGFRRYLLGIVSSRKQSHLYSDTGIFDGTGFFTELNQRLSWKILPPLLNDNQFKDIFSQMFHRKDDWQWVSQLDDAVWLRLIQSLHFHDEESGSLLKQPQLEILEAITKLSYRLTALGLEPSLVRVYPEIESYESPFLGLHTDLQEYVCDYRDFLTQKCDAHCDEKQALVLMDQCHDVLRKIHKRASETGITVRLTQTLVRMHQSMKRIEMLLNIMQQQGENRALLMVQFLKELVIADNRRFSLRDVFATHTSLLALRVTENASHTGEHYVTTSRRDYFAMLRSGMGAGFIVGFMAVLKMLAGKLSLAPIGAAFLFSMNYSLGFMLVHVLHFTIATKQPAMTAASIAASIQETETNKNLNLDGLAELCVNVFRTQFIAILGNVMLSMPMGWVLAMLWYVSTGHHLANPEKVQLLLHDLDPIHSLAIFHAGIAGVCLFLSGLISGYYDNKALHNRISERLRQRRSLQWLLGEKRLQQFTTYLDGNLGALAGNFYFGIMLGSMGTLGFILGLPIDIRHITFSSAYFSFALVGSDYSLPLSTIAVSLAGVIGIGFTNLIVSFGLALLVAMKSRGLDFQQLFPLGRLVLCRFRQNPTRFFWPPKDEPAKNDVSPTN